MSQCGHAAVRAAAVVTEILAGVLVVRVGRYTNRSDSPDLDVLAVVVILAAGLGIAL